MRELEKGSGVLGGPGVRCWLFSDLTQFGTLFKICKGQEILEIFEQAHL